MSEVFVHFARMMGSQQRATLAYRPQANGQQERSVQTVIRSIKRFITEPAQEDWEDLAKRLMFALNTAVDATRKETPFFLVHGWDAKTTMAAMLAPVPDRGRNQLRAYGWRLKLQRQYQYVQEWARQLQATAQRNRSERQNQEWSQLADRYKTGLDVGDAVWLYLARVRPGLSRKLAHLWHGPFRILEKSQNFMVKLKTEGTPYQLFPWVHLSRLKPRISFPERPTQELTSLSDDFDFDAALLPEDSWLPDEEAGEYQVEALLDVRWHRSRSGRHIREYLVKWTGHDEPTWEPVSQLSCDRLLYEFDQDARSRGRFAAMQSGDEELDV
jgi:hypothetical protein